MTYCTRCGTEARPKWDFCGSCGASIDESPDQQHAASGGNSRRNLWLVGIAAVLLLVGGVAIWLPADGASTDQDAGGDGAAGNQQSSPTPERASETSPTSTPEGEVATQPDLTNPEDWTLVGADPGRTNSFRGPAPELTDIAWQTELPAPVLGSPPLPHDDGYVYLGDHVGDLIVVGARDGAVEATRDLVEGEEALWLTAVGPDRLIAAARGGLHALGAEGTALWSTPAGDPSATVADGAVFASVGLGSGTLYAVDVSTGEVMWEFNLGGLASKAAHGDGVVVVCDDEGMLYGIDAETGNRLWRHPTTVDIETIRENRLAGLDVEPVVADGTAYAASMDGAVLAMDLATGGQLWSVNEEDPPEFGMAVNGTTLLYQAGATLVARHTETGQVQWSQQLPGRGGTTTPYVAGDVVVATSLVSVERHEYAYDTVLSGFQVSDGTPTGKVRVPGAGYEVSIRDGVVYVTVEYGESADEVGTTRLVAVR